jgi:hypothetical protein
MYAFNGKAITGLFHLLSSSGNDRLIGSTAGKTLSGGAGAKCLPCPGNGGRTDTSGPDG